MSHINARTSLDTAGNPAAHAYLRAVHTPQDVLHRYDRLWKRYLRYLDYLTTVLNSAHHVTYSRRYWEILLGAWLIKHLMVLIDKYDLLLGPCSACLQQCAELPYPPTLPMSWEVVNSTRYDENASWNEYMLRYVGARIAEFRAGTPGACTVLPQPSQLFPLWQRRLHCWWDGHSTPRKMAGALKGRLVQMCQTRRERKFNQQLPSTAGGTAFSVNYRNLILGAAREEFDQLIATQTQQVSLLPEIPLNCSIRPNLAQRQDIFAALPAGNEEEYLIRASLIDHFPSIYLEGYVGALRDLHRQYAKTPCARVVVFGNLYESVATNFFVAEQVEHHHAKLVTIQHGGGYGILTANNKERWEMSVSDEYRTWGWTSNAHTVPMPAFRCTNLTVRDARAQARLSGMLLVSGLCFPYMNEIYLAPQLCTPIAYRDNIVAFLRAYLACNSGELHWRPYYAYSHSRSVVAHAQQTLSPEDWQRIQLHAREPFYPLIEQMALFVCDHCQTTMLETLAANIPTIVFWDPAWLPPTPTATDIFVDLARVGILHATPRAAAEFIATVAADLSGWWYSTSVQQARHAFVETFARQDAGVFPRYIEFLNMVSSKYTHYEY
ncbi:MAG: hypothetical protein WCJ56_04390 [bacterium]